MEKLICSYCGKEIKEPDMWGSGIINGDAYVENGKIKVKNIYADPDDHGLDCEHCGKPISNEKISDEFYDEYRVFYKGGV